ncbi:SGNH/GDSL hydrolase family protein [Thiotrichales bacterium 19S11-10]|nr:SGNH/GDSL hydrolase family protein [Thiotrichales bacterium 19S11-10]
MNRRFKPVITIGMYLFILFAFVLTQAEGFEKPKFSRFILFGDSLTDTGKMYDKSLGTIPADNPPLQWSTPLYYDGRFSNGPVWIDYLQANYNMSESQVINEAEGGATMYDYMSKSLNPTYWVINTLNYEVSQFLTKIDKNKVAAVNNNDMAIIWIGGNDLITYSWLKTEDIYDDMSKLYLAVDTLVMAGVKNFIILNLPELVMTPKGRDMKQSKQEKLEEATNKFNEQIVLATHSMSAFYTPSGVSIKLYDMMSLFHDALTYPEKYDLTDTRHACYNGSMVGVTVAADGSYTHSVRKLARQWNVTEEQLVSFLKENPVFASSMQWVSKEDEINGVEMHTTSYNPSDCEGHLFFDDVHPTTEVHQIAGDHLYEFIQENWDYQDLG